LLSGKQRRLSPTSHQQVQRLPSDLSGDPLNRLEGKVPFSTFKPPDVCSVKAQRVREFLLRQSSLMPEGPQVSADSPLKVPLHSGPFERIAT